MQQEAKVLGEEVVILEYAEDAQIEQQVKHHQLPPVLWAPIDIYPTQVTANGGQGYEQQEAPVPPAVKHITGNDDQ